MVERARARARDTIRDVEDVVGTPQGGDVDDDALLAPPHDACGQRAGDVVRAQADAVYGVPHLPDPAARRVPEGLARQLGQNADAREGVVHQHIDLAALRVYPLEKLLEL
jgi:hypothetical protein